jgi:hypothetical protein
MEMVMEHPARNKVVDGARRIRKTDCIIKGGITLAFQGPRGEVWITSPTYREAKANIWLRLLDALTNQPVKLMTGKNENEMAVDLIDHRRICLKGLDNYNLLRGGGPKAILSDEFAWANPLAWSEVLRPMLSDKKAPAWFFSSPHGRNHFKDLFDLGFGPTPAEGWMSWKLTQPDVGTVDPEELRSYREGPTAISPDLYAQEWMAEFLEYVGTVVPQWRGRLWPEGNLLPWSIWQEWILDKNRRMFFGAMDWGIANRAVYEWCCADDQGRLVFFDEISVRGQSPFGFKKAVLFRRPDIQSMFNVLDKSAWRRESNLGSVAGQLDGRDFPLQKSDSRFGDSVSRMRTMCQAGEGEGRDGMPKFMIVEGRCPLLTSQLGTLAFRAGATGDSAADLTSAEHDAFDAARYAVMADVFAAHYPGTPERSWEEFLQQDAKFKKSRRHGRMNYHEVSGVPLRRH